MSQVKGVVFSDKGISVGALKLPGQGKRKPGEFLWQQHRHGKQQPHQQGAFEASEAEPQASVSEGAQAGVGVVRGFVFWAQGEEDQRICERAQDDKGDNEAEGDSYERGEVGLFGGPPGADGFGEGAAGNDCAEEGGDAGELAGGAAQEAQEGEDGNSNEAPRIQTHSALFRFLEELSRRSLKKQGGGQRFISDEACLQNHEQQVAAAVQEDGAQKSLSFLFSEAEEQGWEEDGQAQNLEGGQVPQGEQEGSQPESGPEQEGLLWPEFMKARLYITSIEILFAKGDDEVLVHHPLAEAGGELEVPLPLYGGSRREGEEVLELKPGGIEGGEEEEDGEEEEGEEAEFGFPILEVESEVSALGGTVARGEGGRSRFREEEEGEGGEQFGEDSLAEEEGGGQEDEEGEGPEEEGL